MSIDFRAGNCLDVFGAEPDESFDAFVSDWPAGVAFMSRAWDKDHGGRDAWIKVWAEVAAMMYRKAKPGAYSLTWALPRTSHWTACALEDGGWFVQDVITHVFGQGWPKGRAALKPASESWILARKGSGGALQIDAARVARGAGDDANRTRKTAGNGYNAPGACDDTGGAPGGSWPPNFVLSHCPECEERGVRRVKGSNATTGVWNTRDGVKRGLGVIDDGRRPVTKDEAKEAFVAPDGTETIPAFDCLAACDCGASVLASSGGEPPRCACGRAMWWACPVASLDAESSAKGMHSAGGATAGTLYEAQGRQVYGEQTAHRAFRIGDTENGSAASRFFPRFTYQAKAAGGERHAGCDHLLWRADKRSPFGFVRVSREEWETLPADPDHETVRAAKNEYQQPARVRGNVHPTVKSLALMEWLVSLVCPPGGRLGDVTCGSGGTGIALARLNAARKLGASFLGCDICPEAIEIAQARLAWWQANTAVQAGLFGEATVIEPEAKKPSAPKAKAPAAPPPTDPRQRPLFG